MIQKREKEKQEQQIARAERQEFQTELAEHYAHLPRSAHGRRRVITLSVFAILAVLAAIFAWLVLLPSSTPVPGGTLTFGAAAPEFVLPIYGGKGTGYIDLHALRGHPVLINFWSESCPPCRTEVPYLQRVYEQYGASGEFALVGINQADPKDDIASFGRAFKLTYPLLFDKGGAINIAYGVTAIPTTFFIDSNGIVRSVFVRQLDPQTMKQGLASVGVVI